MGEDRVEKEETTDGFLMSCGWAEFQPSKTGEVVKSSGSDGAV